MNNKDKQKHFKTGDLVETVFGNHLGIVLDDESYIKKDEWYVVHLFDKNEETVLKFNRLRKVS